MKHIKYIPAHGKNKGFLLMCAAAAVGVGIGSLPSVGAAGGASPWLHQYFSPLLCGETVAAVFAHTLTSSLLFLLAAFIAGCFVFGQPVGAALLVYRGVGIGVSASAMYAAGGLRYLPAVAVLLLPFALADLFVSMVAVRELFRSSNELLRFAVYDEKRSSERGGFRIYCIRFAVLAAVSFILSLAVPIASYLFGGLL
jgi:hypothetical protein